MSRSISWARCLTVVTAESGLPRFLKNWYINNMTTVSLQTRNPFLPSTTTQMRFCDVTVTISGHHHHATEFVDVFLAFDDKIGKWHGSKK